ncbi:MAG TPA: hypothetical protein VGM88_22685 [Kofleriaceae bacterium]|jgi:hypothetical protein
MRTTLAILLTLAACNHDAPTSAQGSGSAPSPTPEPTPGADEEAPTSKTLPGAGLPGGLRGEPKAGGATLADLGVEATWPDDLRPRWLSTQTLLVSVARKPVMLAKVAAPTEGSVDGRPTITSENGQTNVTCERTLRGATYRLAANNVDTLTGDQIAKLCAALK